ncbi:hypothetical protein [Streptomyces sp. NPDC048295]
MAQLEWTSGDHDVLIVLDTGYDAPCIAHLLSGLPSKFSDGHARSV